MHRSEFRNQDTGIKFTFFHSRYKALYAYTPRNADELPLEVDDIIYVMEKCDDGWYIGTNTRSGQFGTFTGNYAQSQ